MTELVGAFEVIKALAVPLAAVPTIRQVPAHSQLLTPHQAPKQGELGKVSDAPYESILHGAPRTTTSEGEAAAGRRPIYNKRGRKVTTVSYLSAFVDEVLSVARPPNCQLMVGQVASPVSGRGHPWTGYGSRSHVQNALRSDAACGRDAHEPRTNRRQSGKYSFSPRAGLAEPAAHHGGAVRGRWARRRARAPHRPPPLRAPGPAGGDRERGRRRRIDRLAARRQGSARR